MNEQEQALSRLTDVLLDESSTYDDGMVAASEALEATVGTVGLTLDPLEPAIREARHDMAGIAAIVAGSLVEAGATPGGLRDAIISRTLDVYRDAVSFTRACRQRFIDETDYEACDVCGQDEMEQNLDYMAPQIQMMVKEEAPDLEAAWVAVDLVSRAAVAVLSRDPDARRHAATDDDLVSAADALSRFHGSAFFVWSLLSLLEEESLLVLHPESKSGFRFRMSGVADNFQLHALLIDEFVGNGPLDGKGLSSAAADVARGVGPQASDDSIDGAWNLYTYEAVDAFGELPNKHELGGPFWIWNESVPADIPVFEGERIVLLGPSAYARSWQSARAFSAVPVAFERVDELSADEVDAWVQRLSEHARRPRSEASDDA